MRTCTKCPGLFQLTEIEVYKDFSIAKKEKCYECGWELDVTPERMKKFTDEVEELINFLNKFDINWCEKTLDKLVEIISQHILKKLMPNFEIIYMDTGNKNNQYDLLLRNDNSSIALEITRVIDENCMRIIAILDEKKNKFETNLRYNWNITTNKYANVMYDGIKKIEDLLRKIENHPNNINKTEILLSAIFYDIDHEHIKDELEKLGIEYAHTNLETQKGENYLEIYGPRESNSGIISNPFSIFQIAIAESSKKDNITKLNLSKTSERHIFIPIMKFQSEAANYLQNIQKSQIFSKQEINQNLNGSIPEEINVIWFCTLVNPRKDGKMGFRLARIKNLKDSYILEEISNGISSYLHEDIF